MKTVCIYHSIDLDGWMSAAIVKHWFNTTYTDIHLGISDPDSSLDFIGYNYGQPIPDLSEYDKVIMCDISFPMEQMYNIVNRIGNDLIWIDHHISAIKDFETWNQSYGSHYLEGLRDTKYAACELTWFYLIDKIEELPTRENVDFTTNMPEIVRLLGLYDSFRHKGTDEETKVLEFQYGARQVIWNYETAYDYLNKSLQGIIAYDYVGQYTIEDKLLKQGKSIYSYLLTEAKQAYKNGFEIELSYPIKNIEVGIDNIPGGNATILKVQAVPFKFICINKERFNPINFGIDYHKDGYDGAACFHYANGMWNFSIYNDNGLVDCSIIVKQYGGGGHKGASGFKLNNEQFLQLINQ